MGLKLWATLVMMVLSLLNGWYCLGCWEEERFALLHLKENINFPDGRSLRSWVVNEIGTDCCQWQGVECSNITKQIIHLNLDNVRDWRSVDWNINASLFLPFQELRNLSLRRNQLVGWIENEGFDRLSKLRNLDALDLSDNSFDSKILSSLNRLSSLKHLRLQDCLFQRENYGNNLNDLINLKELDLSGNGLRSLGTIYGLKYLKVLNLQSNHFNNSIFSSLHGLSSLESLDLSFNELQGTIQMKDLHALSILEELDLSGNRVDNFTTLTGIQSKHRLKVLKLDNVYVSNISNMVQSLRAFSYLKHFYFRFNYVNGSIGSYELRHLRQLERLFLDGSADLNFLQTIGALTSLKILSLSECGLNGTLPVQGLCKLKNLQELDLSWNEFIGKLPSCIANMTSLRLVELSHNTLTGNIASPPLSKLPSLEYLSLSSNNFQVPTSFKEFFNHSNLKFLFLDNNEMISDSDLGNCVPNFQPEVFSMPNSRGRPTLPNFLYYQSNLRFLDLTNNSIGSNFPTWLLENNTKLRELYLGDNNFIGPLKLPTSTNPNMETFDVSKNKFIGHVPTNITSIFPNLVALNMSTNMFDGCLTSNFGDLKSLEYLDLSSNNLSGTIPQESIMGCFSLYFLKLSDNKLQGQIFPESIHLPYLTFLYLDSNEFSGTIPKSLSTIDLEVLDVSNNHLSGRIPTLVGNMTFLYYISLSNNQLEGPIPTEICNLDDLYVLDLSENNLHGSVPSCFNSSGLEQVHLNNNQLEGELSYAFYNSFSLMSLDLRWNKFIGNIPQWIGNLSSLSIILLSNNHFEGTILHQFCEMDQLIMIDLSFNFLSGQIPPCFGNFTREKFVWFEGLKESIAATPQPYMSEAMLERTYHMIRHRTLIDAPITATFMTKRNSYTYEGRILYYMSGIDLSSNEFHGKIPDGLGNLSEIHSLNLSHNYLIGTIPETFSNLRQIESLDLSYNNLGGRIPTCLIKLNTLEVFSVAHNNLTGMIPEKGQFGTFDEGSYQGNPYLCGHPLPDDCTSTGSTPVLPSADDESEERGFMDMEFFYISFIISYLSVVFCIATILSINPHWRKSMVSFH